MTEYRDSAGKTLTDYPRPSIAVDTAVLTVVDGTLTVVLVEDGRDDAAGTRRLPGTFLHPGETLADAVRRSLADKAGLGGLAPKQLHVFDALDRDDRGWVLSVAHLVAVPVGSLGEPRIVPVAEVGPLAYDHAEILALAVARLRADYASRPDPWGLLGDSPFTLLELERLHRAVDPGRRESKDTFRRLMEPQLTDTGETRSGTVGKPARLFIHPSPGGRS
ncbi:NUDIX hydrolase [Demequina pelophila]|uniref:NUDIX hydrolase n=1 Tax=Demequina pelophila TaxID=1638984 RepID=UPI001D0DC336|nr:NUDIX domain-containing protein [Demequina pelophila]